MNLFEFCDRYHISPAKARRMYKEGAIVLDEDLPAEIPMDVAMHAALARGRLLTAAQLCDLIEQPSLLAGLGTYRARAQAQLAALLDPKAAPREIAAYVTDAAKNDPEAVNRLLAWICATLPAQPVEHAFIAVRLLLGLAPNIRHFDVPRVPRALLNCRKRPEFAGWWRVEKRGAHNATIYQRPALDL